QSLTDFAMDFNGISITEVAVSPEQFFNDNESKFHLDVQMGIPEIYIGPFKIFDGIYVHIDILTINGIANFLKKGHDLNYSNDAQQLILYGDEEFPGLINDMDMGTGMTDWLAMYETATNNALKAQMSENYNCNWNQLTDIYDYCKLYLEGIMIDVFIEGEDIEIDLHNISQAQFEWLLSFVHVIFGLKIEIPEKVYIVDELIPEVAGLRTVEEIGEYMLYKQWANGTLVSDPGYPITLSIGTIYGFEPGV
ncbi:unnamed protein product, partial [marine sediment metagenome]